MTTINVIDASGTTTQIERPVRQVGGIASIRRKKSWRVVTPNADGTFTCLLATPALADKADAPRLAVAAKVSAKGSLEGLQMGLRLQKAKLAKNPNDRDCMTNIAKIEAKIAKLGAPVLKPVNDDAALDAIHSILAASPALAAKFGFKPA